MKSNVDDVTVHRCPFFAWPRNGQAYSLPQWLARLLVPRQSVCQSELLLPLHLQVTVCYTYIFLTPLWLLPFRGKGACILHWTLRAMLLGGNSWQVLPNRTGQGQGVRLNTVKKHPFLGNQTNMVKLFKDPGGNLKERLPSWNFKWLWAFSGQVTHVHCPCQLSCVYHQLND